ncbi:CBS domain-containing protein [Bermanella marisrubri]|uniref:Magnesium and cobalt efflux protein CorC n=1 Tax=Bermanella marisrubri TaxID=207949 RepID=Q1MZI4_9GAMM|nr:transporter associated domain-containing protein [Bermanella marisrubri]EAT11427.1 metal ion transporter, putative [Oceanobacter sp. RED65] [Bermanella marisrubri]QIZ85576.1 CBS domain-containing protein [Bermanella marisrubri]
MNEDRPRNAILNWLDSLKIFGGDPRSRKEIKHILREAEGRQLVDSDALSIMEGAIQVADMQVREIMIPRSQMVCVRIDQKPKDYLPSIIESAHSRFPVLAESDDEVVGILLAKDLLPLVLEQNTDSFRLKDILRPVTFVPESKRLNVLLKEFRATRNHMAIVIDEYGSIAGLVTIEDVLEQIVGDIEDEHDVDDEDTSIKQVDNDTYMVKALTSIDDFNETFGTQFEALEFDTIGGIVVDQFGRLPECEETIDIGQHTFKVVNGNSRQIHLLQVTPKTDLSEED